jgi:hypothetical protein
MPAKKDLWWKLVPGQNGSEDARVAGELIAMANDVVLPFFEKFTDILSLASFLEAAAKASDTYISPPAPAQRLAYAARLRGIASDASGSVRSFLEAISEAKDTPAEEFIVAFARRMGIDQ